MPTAFRKTTGPKTTSTPRGVRYAFTLIEALIAAVILAMAISATSMALNSGRQFSLEARDQVHASLAAEAIMAEILADSYANIPSYNGIDEAPGMMQTSLGDAYPQAAYRIGRRVTVNNVIHNFPELGVNISGYDIIVEAYDADNRVICSLIRFVPEPA